MPDARALEGEIEVADVTPPREPALDQERAHLDAVAIEQRTNDAAAARTDAAEAAPTRHRGRTRSKTVSA